MRMIEEIKADIRAVSTEGRPFACSPYSFETWKDWRITRLKAELLDALEHDGRCVILPNIPYNKTLYWLWGDEIMPVRYRGIRGGCIGDDKKYHVTCRMVTTKLRSFPYYFRGIYRGLNQYPAGDERMFYSDDIGKNIFLTRAEADKKLKEAQQK